MTRQTEPLNSDVLEYTKRLLGERRELLRALPEPKLGERKQYLSCRRSLKQAVHELEVLLRKGKPK